MASARTPTDDPNANLAPPSNRPEDMMEANDIDITSPPATTTEEEISSPWIEVVRRSLRRRPPSPSKSTPESPPTPALRHRPSTRQPRQPPLPSDDFKIGIRPRNGLQLSRADPISLTASIAREIGLPTTPAPFQLRVGAEQNVIVVSTPSPAAARALESLQKIVVFGNRHEVSVYPITPDNSCRGVIHNIAQEHPEEYVKSLITAPGYEVLTARRLGESKAFVITFRGKRVPYYVYVNQALLRCYPYRRTVAFCTLCHQTGHRADVCPSPPATPKCNVCGAPLNEPQHICTPRCGLCKGPHTTASKDCPKRYLPTVYKAKKTPNKSTSDGPCRSRSPSPGSRRNRGPHRSSSRPSRDHGRGPQHGRSTTKERAPSQARNRDQTPGTQRKPPRDQRSASSSVNRSSAHKEPRHEDAPKVSWAGVAASRADNKYGALITQLQAENAALRQELAELRASLTKTAANPPAPSPQQLSPAIKRPRTSLPPGSDATPPLPTTLPPISGQAMPANPTPFITRDEVVGIRSMLQQLTASQQTITDQLNQTMQALKEMNTNFEERLSKMEAFIPQCTRVTTSLPPPPKDAMEEDGSS
ncbi:hypothetical protein HPB48_012616 [Haemaphysalis longicornis]|uniref:Uncharacterized protein n=1 Tax=Haemaphysalis longicornis TaxID=44386 RepID=A0A9J6FQH7_HAELO|nr:hypothetical protein HPB48_012616 [Haemaphysalis longicornis]